MNQQELELYVGAALSLVGLIIAFWALNKFWVKINIFVTDTLKEKQSDGTYRWSKTSVITVTAWNGVLVSFFYDMVKNGFNEIAWFGLAAVATGAKIANAKAKQIDPLIQPPKEE